MKFTQIEKHLWKAGGYNGLKFWKITINMDKLFTDDGNSQLRVDPLIDSSFYDPQDRTAGVVTSFGIGGVWQ